jgi:uncharacterized PurR-regulated membrane protein YhhQ (DUF165 family)
VFHYATVVDSGHAGVGAIVSTFGSGDAGGRRAFGFSADVADFGSRGPRNPAEMIGRAHVAAMSRRKAPGMLVQAMTGLARLVMPVALLLIVSAAAAIYSDLPAEGLGTFAGKPLSLGLALLPVTFFVIHLTNRCYGAGYALGQVVLAWLVAVAAFPVILPILAVEPDVRVVAAFAAGLFFSQLVAIVMFDLLRGPTWWTAPLFASLIGGGVLCLIAFPAAFAGTSSNWSDEMLSFMALCAGAALLLLIPYGLLRGLLPPRPGFGGY